MHLAMLLEMAAEGAPDRVLVGDSARGITAAELLARARRAATAFTAFDVGTVGHVGLNSDAVPVSLFGAALAGLPFAPVNYRLPDEQLQRIIARLEPAVVVADAEAIPRLPDGEGITIASGEELVTRAAFGDDGPSADDPVWVDPESPAILLFTSGTTGEPKAAVLRHRHLTSYVIGSVEFMGAAPEDAQLVCVPPYHIAGISSILSACYSGRRLVYLPAFTPRAWIDTCNEQRITQAMVVPTMLARILEELERSGDDLPTLRHLSYGGGRMPVELIELLLHRFPNVDFVNAYGLTETSSTVTVLGPDDHRRAVASAEPAERARLGSVGRPLPTVEVEIRGVDGGAVPAGEQGEIHVRGEQVSGEYLGPQTVGGDGWFATRDAGFLDDAGFLFLDGRLDDVIVRGGENISPGEIEVVLTDHPAVIDAAVVGVPDAEWGETVAAAVVLAPEGTASEADLQQWVRERLRSTKMPTFIQFRSELPYNETGKLLRRVLRDELAAPRP